MSQHIPLHERKAFDETMDTKLLEFGFSKYDDWPDGLIYNFNQDYDHLSIRLLKHDLGYFLILGLHASGTNPRMNIGSSNIAEDIIDVCKAIDKLW